MIFTVAVGVARTINFSYTNTLSTCPIYVGFKPTVLNSSFCITMKIIDVIIIIMTSIIHYDIKSLIVMQKLEARTVGLKPA